MWRACNLEHVRSQLLDCQTPKEVLLAHSVHFKTEPNQFYGFYGFWF